MAYGESNGHVTDDVTLTQKGQVVTPVRLESNISKKRLKMLFNNNR